MKKHVRLLVLVVVGVVVVLGVLVFRQQQSSGKATEIRETAEQRIRMADAYKKDPEYVGSLFQHARPLAEKEVSKFIGAGFTEERYYTTLLQAMVDKAAADNRRDVAMSLRTWAVGQNFINVRFTN